jgi:hypothetical protein
MLAPARQERACGLCSRRVAAAAAFLFLSAASCQSAPGIDLVPVFPSDDPGLLGSAGVARLDVRAQPIDQGPAVEPVLEIVEQGHDLSITGLATGQWSISVQGLDADGREVVYGRTRPFAIEPGARGEVEFFLGRSFAFNKVALAPADTAQTIAGLVDLTATAFTDTDGVQRILVAGGRRGDGESPVGQAFLVDPATFTVESLPVLSCPRAGHTAFAVETDDGPRVVLAGGVSDCEPALEVFDPARRAFASIAVACPGVASSRGAIPEIKRSGTASSQTGRMLVPGRARCAVDLVSGESTAFDGAGGTAPDSPQVVAVNSSGQVLMVDDKMLFVDGADESGSCVADGTWLPEAAWSGLDELVGRSAVALGNDRFLLAGGTPAPEAVQHYAWSLVSVRDCTIDAVLEGPPASQLPVKGFVPIRADQGTTTVVLFAGGLRNEAPTDAVAVFYQPADALAPAWQDLSNASRERPVSLREPRSGHAAAALDDGTTWIFGGGGGAEIFVAGTRGLDTASHRPMKLRSPMLTSMTVVDTTLAKDQPMNIALANDYPSALYAEADDFVTVFFMAGKADRGVGDDLYGDARFDRTSCSDVKTSHPTEINGVASGYVPSTISDSDDLWTVYDAHGGSTTYTKNARAKAEALLGGYENIMNACSWRQTLRVGLDGLAIGPPVDEGQPKVDTWNGVNVILFASRGDDCSQGVYDASRVGLLPDDPGLSGVACTDPMFDDYFGEPPANEEETTEFEAKLDDMVWDRADLIMATIGNPGDAACESAFGDPVEGGGGNLPLGGQRRLGATVDWFAQRGPSSMKVDLCGAGTTDDARFTAGIAGIVDLIVERNPLQACVPAGIVAAPALTGNRGEASLFLPVDRQGAGALAAAQAVTSACQVLYKESDSDQAAVEHAVARPAEQSADGFVLATDTDGRGGCDEGWLVRLNRVTNARKADWEFKGAALMCIR